jgi:PAS domain S-box-containing protein
MAVRCRKVQAALINTNILLTMIQYRFFAVIKYAVTGFVTGLLLIVLGLSLNYRNGFTGPWFKIFDYAPDFVIIAFAPVFLGFFFYIIGFKREQLVTTNQQIKFSLSNEQKINSAADQQLRLLAKVAAQVNEAIIITDRYAKVEWVNDGFVKINGFTLEEIKGKELGSIVYGPLTDKAVVKRMVEKLIIGEAVTEEIITYHKNGNSTWLSVSIKPIFDDTGETVNFISIQNNITSRKSKEIAIEALYKEVANYKFALDQSAIVIIFNTDGKIVHVNRKFCEVNELAEEELLGKDYRFVSISMRDKAIMKSVWNTIEAGNTWKGELLNRNKNSNNYWADTTIVPLMDADGNPHQFLTIQQDISERKKLQIELLASKHKLEETMKIAKLGSWELDTDGRLSISDELRNLYHLPSTGAVSVEEIFNSIPAEDAVYVKEKMLLCRNSLQKASVEYRYIINGETHYMVSNNTPRLNDAGQYAGMFGTVQDITAARYHATA